MKCKRWFLGLSAFALAFPAGAMADPPNIPPGLLNGPAAMVNAVHAALPAAQAQVNGAAAKGLPAVKGLITKLESMAPASGNATTPKEYALALATVPYTEGDGGATTARVGHVRHVRAHVADACWYQGSNIVNTQNFGIVGGIRDAHGYWCGNGSNITSGVGNFWHDHWGLPFPYCLVDDIATWGWDAPNAAWAHGIYKANQGLWTPWGTCGTYQSRTAAVRIAANGYWDFYNDWGI